MKDLLIFLTFLLATRLGKANTIAGKAVERLGTQFEKFSKVEEKMFYCILTTLVGSNEVKSLEKPPYTSGKPSLKFE